MIEVMGSYGTVVVGGGTAGTIASIASARGGVRTLLVENSDFLGGMVTAGRLTKPSGVVTGGRLRQIIDRCGELNGANTATFDSKVWGRFTAILDPETMQKVIIDMLEEAGVDILLQVRATNALVEKGVVKGIEACAKSGRKIILANTTIDSSGDGDVAAFAGADFSMGHPDDHATAPMGAYIRLINVDVPSLVEFMVANPDDFQELIVLEPKPSDPSGYALAVHAIGFGKLIQTAQADGFEWIIPKHRINLKTGLLPGEININVVSVEGDGLNEKAASQAAIEVRRQAYCCWEFMKRYVPGCKESFLLEVAPRLGIRETRRIICDYTLADDDVRCAARFGDAIGLSECAIDISGVIDAVRGYGIPFRCLMPRDLDGILVAGRCISVDRMAYGSTREVPACAIIGEAAGVAAAVAERLSTTVRGVGTDQVQRHLELNGVVLGVPDRES